MASPNDTVAHSRPHEDPVVDGVRACRTLRADAQRNRDRLVAAARAEIAARGNEAALEDVARTAGVGIGTLYRHFPTRQDLLEAAFLDEALELTVRARELADRGAPLDALVEWLGLQMELGSHGHSMGAAVMAAKKVEGSELQVTCTAMRNAGEVLLRQAQDAGEVRAGIEMVDLLRLVQGITLVSSAAPDDGSAARMFEVVVAGIGPDRAV